MSEPSRPLTCDELLRMMNDYVDGDIDPALCAELQKHLDDCRDCRVVVDTIRKTITLYRDETVYELPASFHNKLHAELRLQWRRSNPSPAS